MQQKRTQSRRCQSRRRPVPSDNSNRKCRVATQFKSEQAMAMIDDYYDRHIVPYLEELAPTKTLRQPEQDKSKHGTGETQ